MRCSLVHSDFLFIGTEESLIYMLDTRTLEVMEKIGTTSYVFTIAAITNQTLICGQYQGYCEIIKIVNSNQLVKQQQIRLFQSNIYKIV